jgi:hypothetical protein
MYSLVEPLGVAKDDVREGDTVMNEVRLGHLSGRR